MTCKIWGLENSLESPSLVCHTTLSPTHLAMRMGSGKSSRNRSSEQVDGSRKADRRIQSLASRSHWQLTTLTRSVVEQTDVNLTETSVESLSYRWWCMLKKDSSWTMKKCVDQERLLLYMLFLIASPAALMIDTVSLFSLSPMRSPGSRAGVARAVFRIAWRYVVTRRSPVTRSGMKLKL